MKLALPRFSGVKILPFLLAAFCLSTSGMLIAQSSTDTSSGPSPAPPYINRAPDHSAWSVTLEGSPSGEGATTANNSTDSSPEKAGNQKTAIVAQSTVMKSGDTIYEQNTSADGKVHQIWHIKGLRIEKGSDGSPNIAPDSGGGSDIYSVNFQNSDFAGLDWVSADTFQGKVKYHGNDVIVFKQDLNPLPADVQQAMATAVNNFQIAQVDRKRQGLPPLPEPKFPSIKLVPAIATIDLNTRLPLLVTIGGEKRTYQYAPLSQSIPMPADIAAAVAEYQRRLKILSQ